MSQVFVYSFRLVEMALRYTCPVVWVYQGTRPSFEVRAAAAKNLSESRGWLITPSVSQYLLVCFFAGYTSCSHLSLSKWDPLLSMVVQSFHLLLGGNSLYRTISFLQCVKTIPLTRHNRLPCAAQAHGQSEQTSHCSVFIPLVLLASRSVLPLLAVPHSAAFYFLPLFLCVLFF